MTESDVVQGARRLRSQLEGELRERLDELLDRADSGQEVDDAVLVLLARDPAARAGLARLAPPRDGERAGFAPLPGRDDPVDVESYVCPENGCGYAFPVFEAGEDAGRCPRHGLVLVPRC